MEIEQDIIEMTAVQAQEYIQIYNDTNKVHKFDHISTLWQMNVFSNIVTEYMTL